MYTEHELRREVALSLAATGKDDESYDVEGIVAEIKERFGLVYPIDIRPTVYRGIVSKHVKDRGADNPVVAQLIAERKRQGVDRRALAKRLSDRYGSTLKTRNAALFDWESGRKVPDLRSLMQWADVLGVSVRIEGK